MKKIVFFLMGVVMFAVSGCIEKSDNLLTFRDEPARVSSSIAMQPMLVTGTIMGTVYAPELADKPVYDGDWLWTYFEVNLDRQTYSDFYTVSNLAYKVIYTDWARAVSADEMTDDYNDKIDAMYVDIKVVEKYLFFWFKHTAPAEQTYEYELLYDSGSDPGQPLTVYIRAKKVNAPTGSLSEQTTCYGFDMSSIVARYRNASTGTVDIKIMYCTSTDGDGKDVYKEHPTSPISWKVADE